MKETTTREEFMEQCDRNQFNLFEGEQRKEEGMQRANGAWRIQKWKSLASSWFYLMPIGTEFASDSVLHACGVPDQGSNRCNVVGAWISGLSKSGRIRFTGNFRKSQRVARHAGLQRVWQKIK